MAITVIRACVCAVTAILMFGPMQSARAHEDRTVGALEVTVGWAEEPAFAGFRNAAQIRLQRSGAPVTGARLKVQVLFGGKDATEKTEQMDLAPAFGSPGEYRAFLVPTRPGTYTFHITGTIGSTRFDQFFTSSEQTFHDVRNATEAEFPEEDPTRGELAEKAAVQDRRIAAVADDADGAAGTASLALYLAIAAVVLGLAGLFLGARRARG